MILRKTPTISIVVPSLNQGQFIARTLESILTQDYAASQILVMDGGSTDDTISVLQNYADRIEWTSEPDNGQSNAINKGFRKCTGDIVCWLNSDDLLEPGSLRAVAEYFGAHESADWLFGRCRIIDQDDQPARSLVEAYKTSWARLANKRSALLVLNYIPQPATFWRRSAMERVGELDETLYYAMDYDYWLRLSKVSPVHFLDRYLAKFRVHRDSKSLRGARQQLAEACRVATIHGAGPLRSFHAAHDLATLMAYRLRYNAGAGA
jgi:glycosyltransferase involved in cell wall biosynthesis